jgi:hypothetical protein
MKAVVFIENWRFHNQAMTCTIDGRITIWSKLNPKGDKGRETSRARFIVVNQPSLFNIRRIGFIKKINMIAEK